MNYRTAHILDATDLGVSGTRTLDINIKDIISRILLRWQITKSKNGMDDAPYKDITKIELVDGSDVLFSMDGGECQALNIYDRKCPSMSHGDYVYGDYQQSLFALDFGRYLYDPELALDPTKFRNPQLKVSWNEALSDTGNADNQLEVLAECFDEKIVSPIGFLMSKQHWSGVPGTDTYLAIDLPTDHPIRKILVKAYKTKTPPWYMVDEVRIDEDNLKRIPFDFTSMENYFVMMKSRWTPVQEMIFGKCVDSEQGIFVTPTNYCAIAALTALGAAVSVGYDMATPGGWIDVRCEDATRTFIGIVKGYLPNHCYEFPFGDQMDIADWYDVTRLGSLRIRLGTGGTAATEDAIVLQQLRRY